MKNKIREKLIASVMLSAFLVTNSVGAALAMEDYYGQGASDAPSIRAGQGAEVGINSGMKISNGDSIVNLSLREADVTQVLRMFADQAGMNVIFAPGVEGNVTMDLVNIPLKEALDLVVKTQKLYYDIKANTLVVSSEDTAMTIGDRGQTMTVIPVKYVNATAISSFLNTSVFSAKGKGNVRPGMSKGYIVATNPATNELIVTGTEKDVQVVRSIVEQFDKKPTITTFRVNHTTPAEMASTICNSLMPSMSIVKPDSGGSSGGAAGIATGFAADEGSSEGGAAAMGLTVGGGKIACMSSAQQMTEESTNGEESFKLDSLPLMNFTVSYFPTSGTVQIIGGSESQLEMIREFIAANDVKSPQAYLEIQIVSLTEEGSKTFDNSWQFLSKNFSFNAGGGTGFSTNTMYPVFFAGHGYTLVDTSQEGWDPDKQAYNTVGKVAKWSTSPQLVYAMNYVIENRKARVLANPKVLLTSGQPSTIDLTRDYVAKVTSQYLDNGSSTGTAQVQKEYEIKEDQGIKVSVTPFISPDGYVTLDIKPEYSDMDNQIFDYGPTGKKDQLVATLLQRRNLDLKGIRIKDGETLVIGGMIHETEAKSVSKIPFLGDIPVLGMFFRSTQTAKAKNEMVIMITPQIVLDTEDAVAEDSLL